MTAKWKPYVCLPRLNFSEQGQRVLGPVRIDCRPGHVEIAFSEEVDSSLHDSLLLESCSLLYFCCTCFDLFYKGVPRPIDAFHDFFAASGSPAGVRGQISLSLPGQELMDGMGRILKERYIPSSEEHQARARKLLLSLRFFLSPLFPHLRNQEDPYWNPKTHLLDAEHFTLLGVSLGILFSLPHHRPEAIFKQKVRQMFQMRYGVAVETMWRWVDEFLKYREASLHGEPVRNTTFKPNASFTVPHEQIAIKLFIFGFFYDLLRAGWLKGEEIHGVAMQYPPLDFREFISLMWSEEGLLHKISILAMQDFSSEKGEQMKGDLSDLSNLYGYFHRRYLDSEDHGKVEFHPLDPAVVERNIAAILNYPEKLDPEMVELFQSRM